MIDNDIVAQALCPTRMQTSKIPTRKKAFGKMHTKPVGAHAKCKDILTRQYDEAHLIIDSWCGITVILRDNIARNEEAHKNNVRLAEAEAHSIAPNLYTQGDLERTVVAQELRNMGINPNHKISF